MGDDVNKGEERFGRAFDSYRNCDCRLNLELVVVHFIGGRFADALGFKRDC